MIKEQTITKEYLKNLDKELNLIPLTFDMIFKGIFERNLELLKRFLITNLELNLDISTTKIELLNNELLKENILEYQKRIDILVVLNDKIFIDIEINRSNFEKVKLRNFMYCDKLYSLILETGQNMNALKDFSLYQLNLNTEDKTILYGEDIVVAYSLVTKNIFIENKYIILKYLDFYRALYYTRGNLKESELWLAALTSENFTELNEILSKILSDKEKNRIIKEAIRMSRLNFNLHEWEKEKLDELVRQESKRLDKEEGYKEGMQEGIQEGSEQTIVKTIQQMLKKEMSEEMISEITEKSIEEIKKIKKDLERN